MANELAPNGPPASAWIIRVRLSPKRDVAGLILTKQFAVRDRTPTLANLKLECVIAGVTRCRES